MNERKLEGGDFMALRRGGIEMFIDVEKSQNKNRLVIGWTNPNQSVGGYLDVTDLFFSIRDYWESTTRRDEEKTSSKPSYVVNPAGPCPEQQAKHWLGEALGELGEELPAQYADKA